jgi:pimeloyl-ACP methyl ester carboxylesterase
LTLALRAFADGKLFGEVWGESPPDILAMHGWGRRGADFSRVLQGFNAIAPDLPGFGASPAPLTPIGAEGYAEMVEPLLDEFDRPPLVVGHSFGGRVGICLAAAFPERVAGLVLTGVPILRLHPATRPAAIFRLVRLLNRIGLVSDERLESERSRRGSADYRAASGVMRDILVTVVNESYEDQLGRVTAPVSMVWGSQDFEVPVPVAEAAAELLRAQGKSVELTVVDGAGHNTPKEAVPELRQAITKANSR